LADPKKKDARKNKDDKGGVQLKPTQLSRAQGRKDELKRSVNSLLNKICPDNQRIIVERLADIELGNADELDQVIQIIFKKALDEPHYCETYADMVQNLKSRYPEFPPEEEGEKPLTFVRVLLNTCQVEFENLPVVLDPSAEERQGMEAEEVNLWRKKAKDRALANMKFIGHLYLRSLLAAKVISGVVHDLLTSDENIPEEHKVECACELLQNVGYTLESTQQGEALMQKFSARLLDLKRAAGPNGRPALSKRVQFQVQDLLDLRSNGWAKKMLKEQAKKKDDIRKDQAQAEKSGKTEGMFQTTTVGVRPPTSQAGNSADSAKMRKGGR